MTPKRLYIAAGLRASLAGCLASFLQGVSKFLCFLLLRYPRRFFMSLLGNLVVFLLPISLF